MFGGRDDASPSFAPVLAIDGDDVVAADPELLVRAVRVRVGADACVRVVEAAAVAVDLEDLL